MWTLSSHPLPVPPGLSNPVTIYTHRWCEDCSFFIFLKSIGLVFSKAIYSKNVESSIKLHLYRICCHQFSAAPACCPSVHSPAICLSVRLPSVCRSICHLSVRLCPFACLSFCPSVHPSARLSVHPSWFNIMNPYFN